MSIDPLPGEGLICGNCRALNPPNALVCASCGVNLADFRAAAPRFRELQVDQAMAHRQQLARQTSAVVADEVQRSRTQLRWQLRLLFIAAVILAVVTIIGAAYFAAQVRLRNERLAAEYSQAESCLAGRDYICARDAFEAVLREDPDYLKAREGLQLARYGLAEQYARSGQWQEATDELDKLLKESPADETALRLMKGVYDRWLADAISRGDWLTAWRVRLRRDALFPPEAK